MSTKCWRSLISHFLPKGFDEKVTKLHLVALCVELTVLTQEQAFSTEVKVQSPFECGHARERACSFDGEAHEREQSRLMVIRLMESRVEAPHQVGLVRAMVLGASADPSHVNIPSLPT